MNNSITAEKTTAVPTYIPVDSDFQLKNKSKRGKQNEKVS